MGKKENKNAAPQWAATVPGSTKSTPELEWYSRQVKSI
jgi:hypothetical protein